MKKLFSLLIIIIFLNISKANTFSDHFIDFEKLVLELKFNTKGEVLIAKAKYTFKPIRKNVTKIYLNTANLYDVKATLKGVNDTEVKIENDYLLVNVKTALDWNKSYVLEITYKANPNESLNFIGWNDKTNRSKKQIWAIQTKYGNWFPSYKKKEDKLNVETTIIFNDDDYEVVSNGELISKTQKDSLTIWNYKESKNVKINSLMFVIGKYGFKKNISNANVSTIQYNYLDKKKSIPNTFIYTNKIMNWFDTELGEFPWKEYKNIPVRNIQKEYNGNNSVVLFSELYSLKEIDNQYLIKNITNLSKQWFGNSISAWNYNSELLIEGLAKNYSKHLIKEIKGENEFQWIRREELKSILNSENNSNRISYVLDMLREVVGEEEFKRTVKQFIEEKKYGLVDIHDFQMAFLKTLGLDVKWFFDEWIYKNNIPEYEISYKIKSKKTIFSVNQNSEKITFQTPIVFQVHYKDGTFDEVSKKLTKAEQTIEILNKESKKVSFVLFDPNYQTLKKISFDKKFNELKNQAVHAKTMIDRLDAIDAMKDIDASKKRDFFIEIYLSEKHRAIKQNILEQLKNDDNENTIQLFVYAIAEKDILLRKTAVKNLKIKSDRYIKFYEEMLYDESPEIVEIGLLKLCEFNYIMTEEYVNRTKELAGNDDNFKLTWLKLKYGNKKKLYSEYVDFVSESFDTNIRMKAISILEENNFYDRFYVTNLVNAFLCTNKELKNKAEKQLDVFLKDSKKGPIVANYIANHKWLSHQESILDNLLIKHNRKIYK